MTGATDDLIVHHDPAHERFEIRLDGAVAVLEYRLRRRNMFFVHTEVPDLMKGRGIAEKLARTGLDFARAQGLRVIALCPYVAAFIQRHSEYQDLLERA